MPALKIMLLKDQPPGTTLKTLKMDFVVCMLTCDDALYHRGTNTVIHLYNNACNS